MTCAVCNAPLTRHDLLAEDDVCDTCAPVVYPAPRRVQLVPALAVYL